MSKVQKASLARVAGDVEQPQALPFDASLMEGFRYRVEDVLKSVTKKVVHNARMEELKNEMLNSKKLHTHFESNPADLKLLQHAAAVAPGGRQRHLATVPGYLMPKSASSAATSKAIRGPSRRKRTRGSRGVASGDDDPVRSLGGSTSLRRAWKRRHKKGKFSERYKRKRKNDF